MALEHFGCAHDANAAAGAQLREHGGREHGGREHGGLEHGDREHGGREHGGREHGGQEHGGRKHGGREHGGREHGGREHGRREHGGHRGRERGAPPCRGRPERDGCGCGLSSRAPPSQNSIAPGQHVAAAPTLSRAWMGPYRASDLPLPLASYQRGGILTHPPPFSRAVPVGPHNPQSSACQRLSQ